MAHLSPVRSAVRIGTVRRHRRGASAIIAGFALFGVAVNAASRAESPERPQPNNRNLKALPKGISDSDVVWLMVRYGQELGVQCAFCHVENPQTRQIDFSSDENPMKQTARIMIGMLSDINTKYLAQVGDRRYAVAITCGNCHQGQTFPPVFEPRASL